MDHVEITLTLTVADINKILKYVGEGHYVDVADLVAKVKSQGDVAIAAEVARVSSAQKGQDRDG
mgnify:FL=1